MEIMDGNENKGNLIWNYIQSGTYAEVLVNFKISMNKKSGGDLAGSTVKGYKIIKMIGEGKFSYVYRAEN